MVMAGGKGVGLYTTTGDPVEKRENAEFEKFVTQIQTQLSQRASQLLTSSDHCEVSGIVPSGLSWCIHSRPV